MALAASEDPASVATYEVKARRGRVALALVGSIVFVAIGIWMLLDATTGLGEKAAGLLAVGFFGWAAVVIVQRMRRSASVMLSREGLSYAFAPHYEARKLIAWRDIDGFGIARVENQEFNFIRLKNIDALARQFTAAEAAQTVKVFRRVMRFGGAAVVVAGVNLEFDKAKKAAEMLGGGGAVVSLADMLTLSRQKYGGEICLGWPDRDRKAAAFQDLLSAWKAFGDGGRASAPRARAG